MTIRHASAPASLAYLVSCFPYSVWFEPVPAMIGTLPAALSTAKLMHALCSSSVSVEPSPVVPAITRASIPDSICQSISAPNCSKLTPSSVIGVIRAVATPSKIVLVLAIVIYLLIMENAIMR